MCGVAGDCLPSSPHPSQGWPPACPVQGLSAAWQGRVGDEYWNGLQNPALLVPLSPLSQALTTSSCCPRTQLRDLLASSPHAPGKPDSSVSPKVAQEPLIPEPLLTAFWSSKVVLGHLGTVHMLSCLCELPLTIPLT